MRCGDLISLLRLSPKQILIIDGFYETVPGAWHKEILLAMGAKISTQALTAILIEFKNQEKCGITEEKLIEIALRYTVDIDDLKQVLISRLQILKPLISRKIPSIYISSDDQLIETLLVNTLKAAYHVHCCPKDFLDFQASSLVIYYRLNYSHPDFERVARALKDDVYLITCGVLHDQLVIDNLYFNQSGLPTHFSNLHDLMPHSNASDRLAFYRGLYPSHPEVLTMLTLSPCQRGYIAYAIYQFLARFVTFDGQPTPYDALNWRWQVDLLTFRVQFWRRQKMPAIE